MEASEVDNGESTRAQYGRFLLDVGDQPTTAKEVGEIKRKAYIVEVLDLVAQVHVARAAAALQVERARDIALRDGEEKGAK
jgi:hypothetical protein